MNSTNNSGLGALLLIAGYHGIAADAGKIAHSLALEGQNFGERAILLGARDIGLKAKSAKTRLDKLEQLITPFIVEFTDHYAVALKIEQDNIVCLTPGHKQAHTFIKQEFVEQWTGRVLLFKPKTVVADDKFGFSWFIRRIFEYKRHLIEVLVAMLFIQLMGLVTPIITQVVIDKVLTHNGLTTLNALMSGLLLIVIAEAFLGASKSYLFVHTASRIDSVLGASLFKRLLSLPLRYFEIRRTGDTVARVREIDNIRQFLTGTPLSTLLDVCFIFVYVAVMFFYSGMLTWIVLGSLPLFAILSAVITPVYKKRLEEKFSRGADNQSYLVEAVSGIQTIKSFALEAQVRKRWDACLAAYIKAGFKTSNLAGIAGSIGQAIQKTADIAVLWYGAMLVIDGKITVGQLIAFRMLSSHVSGPVLRLVQLWQEFQQAGVSLSRIGDIFDIKPENQLRSASTAMPAVHGAVSFEKVRFRYRYDGSEIIRDMSFEIYPGEVTGIIGRSGSGKSTVAKLIQRLYTPESGRILIDGMDIAACDTNWLRRNIGVVLQENFLFNGSIRENIAIHNPAAPIEEVMRVAELAGAHDFILELPEGYDTSVGEKGTALSGGQRQRIAIARALLNNPRVFILDEATSALDYESERIIQENLKNICQGRTVIIIAHRLSTLKDAQRIISVERGEVAENGSPQEVYNNQGLFYHLASQQRSSYEIM